MNLVRRVAKLERIGRKKSRRFLGRYNLISRITSGLPTFLELSVNATAFIANWAVMQPHDKKG